LRILACCLQLNATPCNRNMRRYFKITLTLSLLTFLNINECFSQNTWDFAKEAKSLPTINNKATVKGFAFDKTISTSKDSLKKGFTIELEDPSFKIHFFLLTYDCEDCDIWEKVIHGNTVTTENAPILKKIKKGDLLSIGFFKVEKGKKFYTLPETVIIVTD